MRKLASFAIAFAVAFPAYATNGMRMIGFGPTQNSMGGVGVGATLDAAAVATNPAGLTELGHRADIAGQFFKPTVEYRATGSQPQVFVMQDGGSFDSARGGSPIPAIGYVKPITTDLVTGVGVYGTAGMGVDYAQNLYGGVSYTSYMQGRLTPGVGYRLSDLVSVGVTFNGMIAQMKYDVAGGFGQARHATATALGIGATAGVKIAPTKWVSFGAAYETKGLFQEFSFDIPQRTMQTQAGPVTLPAGTDKLSLNQPQSATVGVAVTPTEMLLLAADVQWINWSDTMGKDLPRLSQTAPGSMRFNMNWSDQWVLKFGAQLSPTRNLKLRAGYNYGKMPLDPDRAFENLVFPAVSEHHVTAGVGYDISQAWAVSVSGMYALKAKIVGSNAAPPNPDGSGGQGISAYSTEMSQLEIAAGATYRF